tara:strand:+ start:796 stop:1413 length:618 start_codon:yes stop_codon:yes gene_type:complete
MSTTSAPAVAPGAEAPKRKSITQQDRKAAMRVKAQVPPDYRVVGVLWQKENEGLYRKYKYTAEALGREWRDQTKMVQTSTLKALGGQDHHSVTRILRPALFATGGALKAFPLDETILRQPGFDDDADDDEPEGVRPNIALETQLRLRMARMKSGYLIGREIAPPGDQKLALVNQFLKDCYRDSPSKTTKTFSKEEFECWVFNRSR